MSFKANNQYGLVHGHSRVGKVSPTYRTWVHMKKRCMNPNDPYYHRYGGRGIGMGTWKEVGAIRELFRRKCPVTGRRLAEYFGVSEPTISDIKRGAAWREF